MYCFPHSDNYFPQHVFPNMNHNLFQWEYSESHHGVSFKITQTHTHLHSNVGLAYDILLQNNLIYYVSLCADRLNPY